jgi:hypothetical protein
VSPLLVAAEASPFLADLVLEAFALAALGLFDVVDPTVDKAIKRKILL